MAVIPCFDGVKGANELFLGTSWISSGCGCDCPPYLFVLYIPSHRPTIQMQPCSLTH